MLCKACPVKILQVDKATQCMAGGAMRCCASASCCTVVAARLAGDGICCAYTDVTLIANFVIVLQTLGLAVMSAYL